MERLRYVARSGGGDPALVVAETVEAIQSLSPRPGELVSLCRNLVDRAITCGPLWWLCARLLAKPDAVATAWDLADEIAGDGTADRVAEAVPEGATVMAVGYPMLIARALVRRADVRVLAVDVGGSANRLSRLLDRGETESTVVEPEAMLAAARAADLVLIESDAVTSSVAVCSIGSGLAAVAARDVGTASWLVAGAGRRLPMLYVDAILARAACGGPPWQSEIESVPTGSLQRVAGPDGVVPMSPTALVAECAAVPELIATA